MYKERRWAVDERLTVDPLDILAGSLPEMEEAAHVLPVFVHRREVNLRMVNIIYGS